MGRWSEGGREAEVRGRKQTSGASVGGVLVSCYEVGGREGGCGRLAYGVVGGEEEGETEDLVCVDGVGV